MRTFLQDVRYGVRTLTRTPGFTVIAIVVLALGIGANALVFSLANTVLLRPLSAAEPDTVVRVYSNRFSNTRHATYLALRDCNSTLAGLASFEIRSFGLRIDRDIEPAFGELVAGNYFPLLGLPPTRGRLLVETDDRPGAPPVVVLSDGFWKNRLGSVRRRRGADDRVEWHRVHRGRRGAGTVRRPDAAARRPTCGCRPPPMRCSGRCSSRQSARTAAHPW